MSPPFQFSIQLSNTLSTICWRAPRHAVCIQLFATCWEKLLLMCRLVDLFLGRVRVGFVAGTVVCIRLFWPFRAHSLDLLGLLRPISRTVGLGQGYCALRSVFHPFCRLCLWIRCVSCVAALSDIVALLGTLSRLGLPYGTSLSTWK